MDPLYIVELDVTVAPGADLASKDVYDRLVEHATKWLSSDVSGITPELGQSGRAELPARRGGLEFERSVLWTVTNTTRVRMLQCSMRQPIEDGHGATFLCDFTIFQRGAECVLRIELGRESADGLMSPVAVQYVRRPGLLSAVLRDPDLRCCCQGQHVEGRYEWINPPQASIVPDVLRHETRLPVLLVDGGDDHAKDLGRVAAAQMAGLAQVLLVDRRAQAELAGFLDEIAAPLPTSGARLIWPNLAARHPEFWDLWRTEKVIATLMKIVAGVSVSARGHNRLRLIAAEEARRDREATFGAALAEAAASGDAEVEAETLRARVTELTGEVEQWVEEVDRLGGELESLTALKSQLDYWKGEAIRAQQATSEKAGFTWDSAPALDHDDLTELAKFLTDAADGSIVFTANAYRTWHQTNYPHIEAMREALLTLAQAAVYWRRAECHVGMGLKDWFKTRWEVAMAPTDEGLTAKKLDRFDYDGKTYSRETHLKLDDHVPPSEVGRVYFGMDSSQRRIIVDHVGLKLYGI